MTMINGPRPLVRETGIYYRHRPLLVELHAGYMVLRRKGTRLRYSIGYAAIYEAAGKIEARRVAQEKAERRQSARKARKR